MSSSREAMHTGAIIEAMERAPLIIVPLVREVPRDVLERRPAPRRWSAHEHACHLALIEPAWAERAERIIREERPTIMNYDPDADEPADRLMTMDLGAALDAYERGRASLVARLAAIPPAAWGREAVHTGHTRYSLYLMCRHAALHDMLHAYRIEESALGTNWPAERPHG